MKFVWVPSISRFRRTETEAKKERLKYEVVEYETDKDSLIDRFNGYEERIEALQEQLRGGSPLESPPAVEPQEEETPELAPDPAPKLVAPPPAPIPAPPSQLDLRIEAFERMNAAALAPIVESAVERLGELGEEGFEALDEYQERDGVGAAFSRGIHILNITATGQHQLARVLMRKRKSKKWG